MKLFIENIYSNEYEDSEVLLDSVVLDVNRNLSAEDLPEWLVKVGEEYEPRLLEKLNAFINGDEGKILDYYMFNEVGIGYYHDGECGGYVLMLSKN